MHIVQKTNGQDFDGYIILINQLCILPMWQFKWTIYDSISGQLLETFRLLIKSQPMFITQTSGLRHSIACCLVSLETKFQFCDEFRCKMIVKILEHVISELSNKINFWTALLSCGLLRTSYRTDHKVLLITLLWVIGSFKDFCRKFSYKLTVSGKSFIQKTVVILALSKQYTHVLLTVWYIMNCTCVHNVFMHYRSVILLEIIVIKLITLACLLTMEVIGNN